jgi:hypothetical protein
MLRVVGNDASDYLQYSTTSANATYHLLAAIEIFQLFSLMKKLANGLDGKNGMADVLDEAKWGLDWLLKMHPKMIGCSINSAMTVITWECEYQKKTQTIMAKD